MRKKNAIDSAEKLRRLSEAAKNICRCGLQNPGDCTRCKDFERDPAKELKKIEATYPAGNLQIEKIMEQAKRHE
jgi:hypothetical protein